MTFRYNQAIFQSGTWSLVRFKSCKTLIKSFCVSTYTCWQSTQWITWFHTDIPLNLWFLHGFASLMQTLTYFFFFLCLQFWGTVSRPWLFFIFLCSSVPPISGVGGFARVGKNQSSRQWPPDQEVPLLYRLLPTLPVPVASIPPGLAAISFSLYSESLTERSRLS